MFEDLGLIQFKEKEQVKPEIISAEKLYVLVKPYGMSDYKPDNCEGTENVKKAVLNKIHPVLILEQEWYLKTPHFQNPFWNLERKNAKGLIYILPLGNKDDTERSGVPLCGWEGLVEIVNSFDQKSTIFGGTFLENIGDETYKGYLGNIYEKIKSNVLGAELDLNLVQWDTRWPTR